MSTVKTKQKQVLGKDKNKNNNKFDFMPHWKDEEKCYEETKIEYKDPKTGKKVIGHWPRAKPQEQIMYELWLDKVRDSETGKFYSQRDSNGNIVKGTGPKHQVKVIYRIKLNDGNEYLYSTGYVTGFDVYGEPVREVCTAPERWHSTDFAYKREYDQKTMLPKMKVVGPKSIKTIYAMPYNQENLKKLFDKRISDDGVVFLLEQEGATETRSIRDVNSIKTFELFQKPFQYLWDAEHVPEVIKAERRAEAQTRSSWMQPVYPVPSTSNAEAKTTATGGNPTTTQKSNSSDGGIA